MGGHYSGEYNTESDDGNGDENTDPEHFVFQIIPPLDSDFSSMQLSAL